jgi:hypothetical protein
MAKSKDKRVYYVDAQEPVTIKIRQRHIDAASCGDPSACVVAQAWNDDYGGKLLAIEVGTHVTKILLPGGIGLRFTTPSSIKRQIPVYDESRKTGKPTWGLPVGDYTFRVPVGCEASGKARSERKGGWKDYPPHGK